jgi:hypothetical protein
MLFEHSCNRLKYFHFPLCNTNIKFLIHVCNRLLCCLLMNDIKNRSHTHRSCTYYQLLHVWSVNSNTQNIDNNIDYCLVTQSCCYMWNVTSYIQACNTSEEWMKFWSEVSRLLDRPPTLKKLTKSHIKHAHKSALNFSREAFHFEDATWSDLRSS